ncbi:hypothetical protein SAMN04490206_3061 [Pseudomonas umsongensis]|nr:hypothetical protein SAMN04490206_3061 [Pseudomonas umsongensis]
MYIHCCGNGHLGFRPYGESLGKPVGARLAGEGVLADDNYLSGVHIHSCGNGHLGFRPYGESLGKTERRPALSNQGLLPLAFGASLRLGIPSLRSCSVGPPRWAILGPARLNRHPCRFTHCAEPPLGLSRGQENQKPKPKRGGLTADLIAGLSTFPCGSQPAGDGLPGDAFIQTGRVIVGDHRQKAGSHRESGAAVKVRSALRPPRFGF